MDSPLELHRASAGSGKTYALAKKFIYYFLTVREENGPRRLRTRAELSDSLRHILAVTFTNKATNEMQQRIVEKLDALANYREGQKKLPDYMKDFAKDLGVTFPEIARVARDAIRILLENYSEFQVSTIDSFFQLVLRTFAYETDLNDSYSIELDSEFLGKIGVDSILSDIEEGKAGEDVRIWINMLMERTRGKGNVWNIFQKRESKSADESPYSSLLNAIKRLETEEFKSIRDEMELYFERMTNLPELYDFLRDRYEGALESACNKMKESALRLLEAGVDEGVKDIASFAEHARKVLNTVYDRVPDYKTKDKFTPVDVDGNKAYQGRKAKNPEAYGFAEPLYREMVGRFTDWLEVMNSRQYRQWKLYDRNFPYLGLMAVSLRKRREYLEENNSVELAETNALLRRIIGEDDAPFIYERLGARLNHFLIDEFQDTSRLQWENLRPLLSESLGRGNENLLIGDAKQSIYRFRNADPSLIVHRVEDEFDGVRTLGNVPAENTNWRSDRMIVDFNNRLFQFLSDSIANALEGEENRMDFRNLYENVVQKINAEGNHGYVQIEYIPKETTAALEKVSASTDEEIDSKGVILRRSVDLVNELLGRGYRMGDIAFLVVRNEEGEALINAFTEYNAGCAEGDRKIEFISEQSLKVAAAPSVKLIETTLETIGRGSDPEVREGDAGKRMGVADWQEIRSNFQVFSIRHGELSTPDKIATFLKSGADTDAIADMLAGMQAVTLPALVEGIVATFLTEGMRRTDAPFISAFQDIVLEYCESHPSDIGSFLKWWEPRKNRASISSPEGTDAVRVMTIHKSKGLEFPCVVLPFADAEFLSEKGGKREWRWVKPQLLDPGEFELPPYMPVTADDKMVGTTHEPLYRESIDLVTMDTLNLLYVGCTRAVNELYIFCRKFDRPALKGAIRFGDLLRDFMEAGMDDLLLTYGRKEEERREERKKEDKVEKEEGTADLVEKEETREMHDYNSRVRLDFLKCREEDVPTVKDAGDVAGDEEDTDPRSEGNLMHGVMEYVKVAEDLAGAVRKMVIKGLMTRDKGTEVEAFLRRRIMDEKVKEWFDGSARVVNERVLIMGKKVRRPDRILIYPGNRAVVVDYKFGHSNKKKDEYSRQVKEYVDGLKATGRFISVKGYLWYVAEDRIDFVCD